MGRKARASIREKTRMSPDATTGACGKAPVNEQNPLSRYQDTTPGPEPVAPTHIGALL